jgi:hypothetical protein
LLLGGLPLIGALSSCGGGSSGNPTVSNLSQTYLSVDATDADGDALQYQWRVNGGTIQNVNSNQTVWTLPDGPGLHFAYVMISDGKGGYVEQQYSVSSDATGTTVAPRQPVTNIAPPVSDFDGNAPRLRFRPTVDYAFATGVGTATLARTVYMPDLQVQVVQSGGGPVVFSGVSDLSGEVSLPKLQSLQTYVINCSTSPDVPLTNCGQISGAAPADVNLVVVPDATTAALNLHLHGHVALADGGVCGNDDEFFGLQSAASVQVQQTDGTPVSEPVRVNRYGDYAVYAAVALNASLKLQVQCESFGTVLDVPPPSGTAGYVSTSDIELSYQIPNSRPQLIKMVAVGADGNVRGQMVLDIAGAASNSLPGANQFLTYKGKDTRLSSCMYYRALGAAKDCDSQGNMTGAISFDDWKLAQGFKPQNPNATEVSANYVNKMDLNLVRQMVATQSAANDIAFYVCNHPGPVGVTQDEVNDVIDVGLNNQKLVACVAMEWSTTPGVNGGAPFTKFLTFAPDGSLLPSINLDGRGEKYMPGACIACHGGTQYNGHFPDKGNPSPLLGAGFLPFDTGNYLFSVGAGLSELEQSDAFHALNQLVAATEAPGRTSLATLMQGWYPDPASTVLNKEYVPSVWAAEAVTTPGADVFYKEVIGSSCRTCHISMNVDFNWDNVILHPQDGHLTSQHVCGGTADVANNASMPNALISRDRVAERVNADPNLARLTALYLGCIAPLPDPVYPKR